MGSSTTSKMRFYNVFFFAILCDNIYCLYIIICELVVLHVVNELLPNTVTSHGWLLT